MKVVVYKKTLFWRCKLIGKNGEILMISEAYASHGNARRAAHKLSVGLGVKYEG